MAKVKYASTRTKKFKPSGMMPGSKGAGNVRGSRLNAGGDTKWRGKRGKGKCSASGPSEYGY